MRASAALKQDKQKERGSHLQAVPARAAPLAIKVYCGSQDLKAQIEQDAEADRPGQSASAYLLKCYWKEKRRTAGKDAKL